MGQFFQVYYFFSETISDPKTHDPIFTSLTLFFNVSEPRTNDLSLGRFVTIVDIDKVS